MEPLVAEDELAYTCFAALDAHLSHKSHTAHLDPQQVSDKATCALFVTWTTTRDDALRGCIGNLSEIPKWTGLCDYAVRAAVSDHRFKPVTRDELPGLTCGVSLLSAFERAATWNDWVIGIHGIILRVTVRGNHHSATYLPEVASEQQWTHRETVTSLLRKAGVEKRDVTDSLVQQVEITRYVSSKRKVTFREWKSSLT